MRTMNGVRLAAVAVALCGILTLMGVFGHRQDGRGDRCRRRSGA